VVVDVLLELEPHRLADLLVVREGELELAEDRVAGVDGRGDPAFRPAHVRDRGLDGLPGAVRPRLRFVGIDVALGEREDARALPAFEGEGAHAVRVELDA
jgi:hypothetical protein